ncbi:hypothetical protein [Nostoc sp.]|uniref:hypothetical protein n=1 Tax=Nostoc sp. TaxID=1180 RepID=UPI002FF85688
MTGLSREVLKSAIACLAPCHFSWRRFQAVAGLGSREYSAGGGILGGRAIRDINERRRL